MKLDEHIAALRELGDDPDDGAATRLRVRRSLEQRVGKSRQPSLVAVLAVLLVASASWGFATGRISKWVTSPPEPIPVPVPAPAPVAAPAPTPRAATHVVAQPVAPESPPSASRPPTASVAAPRHRIAMAPAEPPVLPAPSATSERYATAHELYFHGGDYAAALAAFDDYLAHEPDGPFVAEARYNRALCLVRLDRLADAERALQPFAEGVVLAGYRQADAKLLSEKIARRLNGTK